MKRIQKLIRMNEWMFSKIPFMFVPVLLCMAQDGREAFGSVICATYFVYLFAFFSFGYAINDYSDIEADRMVNKQNIMGELSPGIRLLVLVLCFVGALPMVIVCGNRISLVNMALVYFWGAAYSVWPFRFKERGVWGLIVCSLAQRSLPLLPLLAVSSSAKTIVIVWSIIGGLVGLRYILIHQVIDVESDRISKTETFAVHHFQLTRRGLYMCFILEVAVVLGFLIWYHGWQLALVLGVVYGIIMLVIFYTVHFIYEQSYLISYIAVPFEDFYNFYYPLFLSSTLLTEQPVAGVLLVFLLLIGIKPMINKWKIMLFGMRRLGEMLLWKK